jgi:putative molybdenum carrier protein
MFHNITILSGGQSGVDRAALLFAFNNGINIAGWCPLGRIAEDGTIADHYPLKETNTSEYCERTKLNVRDSDGTLIIYNELIDDGTKVTIEEATLQTKPYHKVNLSENSGLITLRTSKWLKENNIKLLNIAVPRESSSNGIYNQTMGFLVNLFSLLK